MKNRKYPTLLFISGLLISFFIQFSWLFLPGVVLLIVGIFVDVLFKPGLALLLTDFVISFITQIRVVNTFLEESDSDEFDEFRDAVLGGGNVFKNIGNFVADRINDENHQKTFFVDSVVDSINKKCKYGDKIDKLNGHERVIFVVRTLEDEVNNGGFGQFFYNSSGDFSNEIVDAFTQIGALKTAEICKRAVTVFGENVPADRSQREDALDELDCDDLFDELDDKFYDYEDNLVALIYSYVMTNNEAFGIEAVDIEGILYDKVKSVISDWDEEGIYAISFFVYSNEAYEYNGFSNVSTFAVSYNTESDCNGAGELDEERWNYAFWRQDETSIIDIDNPNDCNVALYKWYALHGIENIGYEDTENQYDENCRYIGKGPVGHYELVGIVSNVAKKLQEEGFIKNKFGSQIPIIIHGLEYAWYDIEATKNANTNGEAETFIKAMVKNGMI